MTMLTLSPIISSLVTISCLLVTRVTASPIETQDEAMEHRAGEALDSLVTEFRDSSVYPLILNPLAVNKLHCGSVITFYDNSASADATVAVDVCLTALILAKALILWSVLSEGIELDRLGDGGVFSILDKISEAVAKFDLAGTGPEGEPFADIAAKNGEEGEEEESQDGAVQKQQQPYAYVSPVSPSAPVSLSPSESYNGFGLNSWQSGPQAFPDLTSLYNGNLARAFSSSDSGEIGDLVKATLSQLNKAVTVKSH